MIKTIASPKGAIHVEMTDDEVAERQSQEKENISKNELNRWLSNMQLSDQTMPRSLEDIIDVLTDDQRGALPAITIQRYNDKKSLRASKPNG